MPTTRVSLEVGKRWVIASAVDWPGWCRRGRDEQAAIDTLLEYAPRYRQAVGAGFDPGEPQVIGSVPGTPITDFWAPSVVGPWDHEALDAAQAERIAGLMRDCWRRFDEVVAGAPESLRKGPKGGGRDRSVIRQHVNEADRSYARKVGVKLPPRTPVEELRSQFSGAVASAPSGTSWPLRYVARRSAWHALDHAWEIEDRTE
jgi:hypothetical protein